MAQPPHAYLVALALDIARLCAWLVLLLVFFAAVERRFAHRPQKLLREAFAVDLAYFFINGLVPKLLLMLPLSLLAAALHQLLPSPFYATMVALPLGLRVAAALVVAEVGAYWGHRLSHDIPFMWRFHAVHHSPRQIDWLVNSRGHPVDLVFTRLCALAPVYALGLAQPGAGGLDLVPVLLTLAGTFWGFLIHANVNWRFGRLEWLVSSPAFHHWHHANDGPGLTHQNFAPMLPLVDRCFGTLHIPGDVWPVAYGTDTPVEATLGGQLLEPFSLRARRSI